MLKRNELLRTEEYWFETLQNDIYRMVTEYMQKERINQTQLAKRLDVSKGYISQIINGNFNYTIKKMIELSLALNKAPAFEFKDLEQYIQSDQQNRFDMECQQEFTYKFESRDLYIPSGKTCSISNVDYSLNHYKSEVA